MKIIKGRLGKGSKGDRRLYRGSGSADSGETPLAIRGVGEGEYRKVSCLTHTELFSGVATHHTTPVLIHLLRPVKALGITRAYT